MASVSSDLTSIPTDGENEPDGGPLPPANKPEKRKLRKRCSEAREALKRRRGAKLNPHNISKKFRALDLFPEITKQIVAEEEEKLKQVQEYQENLTKHPHNKTFLEPTICPTIPRVPTENEYAEALRQVQDTFRPFDHGSVWMWEAKYQHMICVAEFLKIAHLHRKQREGLDSLCDFLHGCKKFISLPASQASHGEFMSGIGWSSDITRLEILDEYRNEEAIETNQEEYHQLMEGAANAGEAIWVMWDSFTNLAAKITKEHLKNFSGSATADLNPPAHPNAAGPPRRAAASLAFPSNGFHIQEPEDKHAFKTAPKAFAMIIPTFKSTGKIALASEGHRVDNGQMIFPNYKIAVEFPPDTIVMFLMQPQTHAHGTMKSTEFGDSTRLGVCIQAATRPSDTSKGNQDHNEETNPLKT